MLHAITCEHLQPPVIQLHWDVDRQLPRRGSQHFLHPFVQIQVFGSAVEARLGGQQRVQLVGLRLGYRDSKDHENFRPSRPNYEPTL